MKSFRTINILSRMSKLGALETSETLLCIDAERVCTTPLLASCTYPLPHHENAEQMLLELSKNSKIIVNSTQARLESALDMRIDNGPVKR